MVGRRKGSLWAVALAAVALLSVALPAAVGSANTGPQAHASEVNLGAINVPLDGTKVYTAPLVAGGVYRIAASGTYAQHGGTGDVLRDAVYCYDFYAPPVGCSPPDPPRRSYQIIVRFEGDTANHDLDDLDPSSTLPYNPLHTYQQTFTAPASSRLEIFFRYNATYTYDGSISLNLYQVSVPAGPPPGGGPPGTRPPLRKLLDPTKAWGEPGPGTDLAPGDQVIAQSPKLGPGQREATVTVKGDPDAQVATAIQTARDCVRVFIEQKFKMVMRKKSLTGQYEWESTVDDDDDFILSLLGMFACLEELRAANTAKASGARHATASRSRCARNAAHVVITDIDRTANHARFSVRRSRRVPKRLRISCRPGAKGAMTLRIRAASRRTPLRKVVGKRLVLGVYRAKDASGTAKVRTTFKR